MTNTQATLLPCPFCRSREIQVHAFGRTIGGEPDAFCQCHDCTTTGPNGNDEAQAIAAWNRRAEAQGEPACSAEQVSEREAFEKWLCSIWTSGYACPRYDDGRYVNEMAQAYWSCWQAALSCAPAAPKPAITAEALLRTVFQRPDLTEQDREWFFKEFMIGDDELSLTWSDFRMMAAAVRALLDAVPIDAPSDSGREG